MIPFPVMVKYGNKAPTPAITIKSLKASSSGNSEQIHYSTGELYALGTNTQGRFGTGDTTNLTTWTQIATNVSTYITDGMTSLIVKNDGTIWACGNLSIYNGPNLNGSSTGWGVTTPSYTFVDMTYTYPALMKSRGIKQIESSSSPVRQWVVDNTGVLWGLGSQASYTLGTNVTSPNTDWIQIATGVDKVFAMNQAVWILKTDKTIWRSGINTSGQVAGTATTDQIAGFTELNIYAPLTYLNMNVTGTTTVQLLLSDGSMRFYGTQGWVNSSGVQLQPGYTPSITGSPAVNKINTSNGFSNNYYAVTANNIWVEGSNGSGSLGYGTTASAYAGTWYTALTGVLNDPSTAIDVNKIQFMTNATTGGFIATDSEVYVTGATTYTMTENATGGYWQVQRTPHSAIWTQVDANPTVVGTVSNISTTTPNLARYYHYSAKWGNKLVVFGGLTGSTAFAEQAINIFDTTTNTWSTIANTPGISRFGHGMTVVGDLLYICGGFSATSGGSSATMYSVNLNTGVWTTLATAPTGGYSKLSSTSDGKIWLWGANNTATLYLYDSTSNTWSTKTSSPITSSATGDMKSDGTYLYIQATTAAVYKYIPNTDTWIQLQNRPDALAGRFTYNNGVLYSSNRGVLYAYRISTGVWSTVATGLPNYTALTLNYVNGAVYVVGGQNSTSTANFYKIV